MGELWQKKNSRWRAEAVSGGKSEGRAKALPCLTVFAESQQIVCVDAVVLAESDEMMDGQLVGSTLVTGVHRLGCSQHLSDLRLRFVGVLP